MAKNPVVIESQPFALLLGAGALIFASWCFSQAWESRGAPRPWFARPFAV